MLGSSTPGQVWQTTNCQAASCRDDCGEKGGAWYPPWELMMVLGLEFLAWLLPGSLSLLHS